MVLLELYKYIHVYSFLFLPLPLSQEISLKEGDIFEVIGKEDDVWWCGKLRDRIGMFPANYVEEYYD